MAAILYTVESLEVLGVWAWLGVIRPMRSKLDIGLELLIYDCGTGHCSGIIRIRYICVNIHSPWQQYYILQNPLQFSIFGCGWV